MRDSIEHPEGPHLFPQDALSRLGNDWSLLQELYGAFQVDVPAKLMQLEAALGANDLPAIQRHAHTIKGAAAIIGALPCRQKALAVENLAKEGAREGLPEGWAALRKEAKAVLAELESASTEPLV